MKITVLCAKCGVSETVPGREGSFPRSQDGELKEAESWRKEPRGEDQVSSMHNVLKESRDLQMLTSVCKLLSDDLGEPT